jgi:hypothetical protein
MPPIPVPVLAVSPEPVRVGDAALLAREDAAVFMLESELPEVPKGGRDTGRGAAVDDPNLVNNRDTFPAGGNAVDIVLSLSIEESRQTRVRPRDSSSTITCQFHDSFVTPDNDSCCNGTGILAAQEKEHTGWAGSHPLTVASRHPSAADGMARITG